ncbi:hypothetical protein Tco_1533445 [Tanacetum coccineum]
MHPVDPPSPDYVLGPKEPEQAPFSLDYVAGPEYLEYLTLSDKEVPIKDQPYATVDSPIALSTGYIADSDVEEDPKDESEDVPTDYPTDGGDDDDDDDDDWSGDDADDEDEEEVFEKDEVVEPVLSTEETQPFETNESAATPPPAYQIDRLLAIPTPPPSPLTPLSSPLHQVPSQPFPIPSPPTTSPTYTEAPLGYRAAGIQLRTASPPSLPLSSPLPLSPPIILPYTRASIADVLEAVLPPQKRLCIALGPRFEVRKSSSTAAARSTGGFRVDYGFFGTLDAEIRRGLDREVCYGITDVWVDLAKAAEEIPPTTLAELSQRVINFFTTVRQDTYEIYVRLDNAQSDDL